MVKKRLVSISMTFILLFLFTLYLYSSEKQSDHPLIKKRLEKFGFRITKITPLNDGSYLVETKSYHAKTKGLTRKVAFKTFRFRVRVKDGAVLLDKAQFKKAGFVITPSKLPKDIRFIVGLGKAPKVLQEVKPVVPLYESVVPKYEIKTFEVSEKTQFLEPVEGGSASQFAHLSSNLSGSRVFQIGNGVIHFYNIGYMNISYQGSVQVSQRMRELEVSPDGSRLWAMCERYQGPGMSYWDLLGIDIASREIIHEKKDLHAGSGCDFVVGEINGTTEIYIINPSSQREILVYKPDDNALLDNTFTRPDVVNWVVYPVGIAQDGNALYVAMDRSGHIHGANVLELIRYDIQTKQVTGGPWTTELKKDRISFSTAPRTLEKVVVGEDNRVYVTLTNIQEGQQSRVVCFDTETGKHVVSSTYFLQEDGMINSLVFVGGAVRFNTNKGKFITLHPHTLEELKRENIPLEGPQAKVSLLTVRGNTGLLLLGSATFKGSVYDKSTVRILVPCSWENSREMN